MVNSCLGKGSTFSFTIEDKINYNDFENCDISNSSISENII